VHWRTVFSSILYRLYKGALTPDSIKEIAERYKEKVLPAATAIKLVKDFCPSMITMLDDITIYDISDRMQPVMEMELQKAEKENLPAHGLETG
jgi:hypothetical protein